MFGETVISLLAFPGAGRQKRLQPGCRRHETGAGYPATWWTWAHLRSLPSRLSLSAPGSHRVLPRQVILGPGAARGLSPPIGDFTLPRERKFDYGTGMAKYD